MGSDTGRLAHSTVGEEALDDPATAADLVERMLNEITVANRWFGGRTAVRLGLHALLQPADRGSSLSLLDLGTGAGDLPLWARAWSARRGVDLVPFGLERLPAAARLARRAGLPVIFGSASALPLRNRSVDIVLLSQLIHHFDDRSISLILQEASRVARRGVIVAELRPSRLAGFAFRAAGALLGFHRVTVADGVTSLARGLSAERLHRLALPMGRDGLMVATSPMARITAAWTTAS